jgi:hypothetical protein
MRALCATESEVYKLEDFAATKPQNLPPESCAKHGRYRSVIRQSGMHRCECIQ